jgi:RHS repeat-associated protein
MLQPYKMALNTGSTLNMFWFYCSGGDPNFNPNPKCTNNNGNLVAHTFSSAKQGTTTQTFGYDAFNRMTTASEWGWSRTYSYDSFGNGWLTAYSGFAPDAQTPQTNYFPNNRWSDGLGGFAYDNAGNQTAAPSRSFGYDSEERLKATTQPGMSPINYTYDGEGRRVTKTVGSATTVYVYDAMGQLAAEYTTQTLPDAGTAYFAADHLGSTRLLLDATGAIKKCYDYYPFGENIAQGVSGRGTCYPNVVYPTGTIDSTDRKFTGKERDAETGLDYFGARYYDIRREPTLRPAVIH